LQYGTLRVYEFGPEKGRKVLLIHGISTPCVSLGAVAQALTDKGCRVMLFDLWGRGYSDEVDLPHDSRLYTTEILLALTSSPLSWTPDGFSVIGYSLGGGIAADFTSNFPDLVKSVVLLAPSGLIRGGNFGWLSRFLYSGLVPFSLLEWIVKGRFKEGPPQGKISDRVEDAETSIGEEVLTLASDEFDAVELSKNRPGVTVAATVQWQVRNHQGFVKSFISSIKHSSIKQTPTTLENWRRLGLRSDKVLIFVGSTDPVIIPAECKSVNFRGSAVSSLGDYA
jgi:pimeloyl-ACP methyl ester carboxylesterase